ncbi:MAG: hypothetical protein JSR21_16420 [Proteobacteria bacterium]|nr:hypothetical protein [Pseudomonadota bacterium]
MKARPSILPVSIPLGALRRLLRDRRGATALMVATAMVGLVAMGGVAADVGYAMQMQGRLQAATDAAALAGAQDINCCSSAPDQAITTATAYSAVTGGRNVIPGVTASMASGYPKLKCFASTGVSCTGTSKANGIVVKQTATVPTIFSHVLGIKTFTLSATSTAGVGGGKPKPMNVMLVLDTTGSMNTSDANCSIKGATRLSCALGGVRTILTSLAPSVDKVGLMVFPGLTATSQAPYDYDCSSGTKPKIAGYNASPVYQVLGLSSDYRSSDGATTLNTSSSLTRAAGGGGSGCSAGISAVGGVGTFYADAITTAQNALTAAGNSTTQNVLILLSDGDASASSRYMPSAEVKNQCHEAITAAQAATAAGTWVYSIAYGASGSSGSSCSTDSPAISACAAMQQIASDASKFYTDTSSGSCTSSAHSVSDLVSLFQSLAQSLLPPRLLPDNTT